MTIQRPASDTPEAGAHLASLPTVMREWGRIGCIGFGGPPAHIALLRKLCVDDKKWLDATEFEDAIAACNLLPGPASTQLAILCAWRVRGRAGALAGGAGFILPGLVVILALSVLFLAGSPPRWVMGAGAGAGSAVAAVAVQAGWSLVRPSWRRASRGNAAPQSSKGTDPASTERPSNDTSEQPASSPADRAAGGTAGSYAPGGAIGGAAGSDTSGGAAGSRAGGRPGGGGRGRWVVYLVAGGVAAATIGPWLVLVLLGCGLAELALRERGNRRRPGSPPGSAAVLPLFAVPFLLAKPPLPPIPSLLARPSLITKTAAGAVVGGAVFGSIAWVAFKVGALSFGGGFVIIPLMQADAVGRHWMTSGQFLNAVALGQVTPGPVVLTVAAVGFAAAGLPGGLLATAVAFTPSFAFILGGAPYFQALRGNARAQAFLGGAGPAAIGAIFGSAYLLARALSQPWQYAILAAAVLLLLIVKRGVVLTLLCAAAAGVVIVTAGGPV